MNHAEMINACLDCAVELHPEGPWLLVVVDRNRTIVARKRFAASQQPEARRWLLETMRKWDGAPGLMPWADLTDRRGP